MTHEEVIQAILFLHPDAVFGYDGDGSSLDPVYDGDELVARGLEWQGPGDAPTLTDLETAFADAQLQASRAAKTDEIKSALAATSVWIERAFEEGIELPAPRKAYREALRELLLQAAGSNDPESIEIPTAPSWVPPTS